MTRPEGRVALICDAGGVSVSVVEEFEPGADCWLRVVRVVVSARPRVARLTSAQAQALGAAVGAGAEQARAWERDPLPSCPPPSRSYVE